MALWHGKEGSLTSLLRRAEYEYMDRRLLNIGSVVFHELIAIDRQVAILLNNNQVQLLIEERENLLGTYRNAQDAETGSLVLPCGVVLAHPWAPRQ